MSNEWIITREERTKHDAQFEALAPVNNLLSGEKVRPVLMKSNLPVQVLGHIWNLADIDGDGSLNKLEYSITIHLIRYKLQGKDLPKTLPASLSKKFLNKHNHLNNNQKCLNNNNKKLNHSHQNHRSNNNNKNQYSSSNYKNQYNNNNKNQFNNNNKDKYSNRYRNNRNNNNKDRNNNPKNQRRHNNKNYNNNLHNNNKSHSNRSNPNRSSKSSNNNNQSNYPNQLQQHNNIKEPEDPPLPAWANSSAQLDKYKIVFQKIDRLNRGYLTGLEARAILSKSGLPNKILAQIWNLSDVDDDGCLNEEEFYISMHFTEAAKLGQTLPVSLPSDFIPLSMRRATPPQNNFPQQQQNVATSQQQQQRNKNPTTLSQQQPQRPPLPTSPKKLLPQKPPQPNLCHHTPPTQPKQQKPPLPLQQPQQQQQFNPQNIQHNNKRQSVSDDDPFGMEPLENFSPIESQQPEQFGTIDNNHGDDNFNNNNNELNNSENVLETGNNTNQQQENLSDDEQHNISATIQQQFQQQQQQPMSQEEIMAYKVVNEVMSTLPNVIEPSSEWEEPSEQVAANDDNNVYSNVEENANNNFDNSVTCVENTNEYQSNVSNVYVENDGTCYSENNDNSNDDNINDYNNNDYNNNNDNNNNNNDYINNDNNDDDDEDDEDDEKREEQEKQEKFQAQIERQKELDKIRKQEMEKKKKEDEEKIRKEIEERKRLEEIERKKKEEFDRQKKEEFEKYRLAELEKQKQAEIERHKQIEREKEEQKRRAQELKEAQLLEEQRQRQLDWEHQRRDQLVLIKAREQNQVDQVDKEVLRLKKVIATHEKKKSELESKLAKARTVLSEFTAAIDGMRLRRDQKLAEDTYNMVLKNIRTKKRTVEKLTELLKKNELDIESRVELFETRNNNLSDLKSKMNKLHSDVRSMQQTLRSKRKEWEERSFREPQQHQKRVHIIYYYFFLLGLVAYQALYEFTARSTDELSLRPGDIVWVNPNTVGVEEGWVKGDLNGESGVFPESYVQKVEDTTATAVAVAATTSAADNMQQQQQQASDNWAASEITSNVTNTQENLYISLYDYVSNEPGDLNFKQGEMVEVTEYQGDWWQGNINQLRFGVFPANFVGKPTQQQLQQYMQQQQQKQQQLKQQHPTAPTAPKQTNDAPKLTVLKKPEIATAIAAYEATGPEQLTLQPGHLLQVRKKTETGWWEGELQVRGQQRKIGWFPSSYVKLLGGARHSADCLNTERPKASKVPAAPAPEKMLVLYDFQSDRDDELSFKSGDVITVISKPHAEWWNGELNGAQGIFPANFVGPCS
ncbi:hypothetical protein HELRODRAFT_190881 [Helobdella robusta]|uniref:Uncharacterized protein n=1 Tax=Helobdella robusta TaxID=6412 RepID=T1FSD9_HELRO|nr:hypothetical protein HELRODRAFT_190881 [Helobdella robusta]ESO08088.1 hypothetical protein HELRODRAFT_190881 [Helobdella robusta]